MEVGVDAIRLSLLMFVIAVCAVIAAVVLAVVA